MNGNYIFKLRMEKISTSVCVEDGIGREIMDHLQQLKEIVKELQNFVDKLSDDVRWLKKKYKEPNDSSNGEDDDTEPETNNEPNMHD